MKLELFCDGKRKCELELLQYEFMHDRFKSWEANVEYRERRLEDYKGVLKADCYKQIGRAKEWEIFLVAESKLNSDIEHYANSENGVEIPKSIF